MWWAVVMLAAGQAEAPDELVVNGDGVIAATVAGQPARLRVESGRVDRLTLDPAFVAKYGIKPATIAGRAEMEVAGRREFKGRNRSLALTVAGRTKEARAFWFEGTTMATGIDGTVGPYGLPQARVSFTLSAPKAGETVSRAPLRGEANTSGYTAAVIGGRPVAFSFEPMSADAYPIASAAAGALLAQAYGGTVSGASWDVDVLMGVHRPVRLLTLTRPVTVGPLRYTQFAVRVPDRVDLSGKGMRIAEAGEVEDPAEVVVEGNSRGPKPSYVITIPRAGLAACSRITFDKAVKAIELACVAAGEIGGRPTS